MLCFHVVHSCQQYCLPLLHLIQAEQYCSILSTLLNGVVRKIRNAFFPNCLHPLPLCDTL